MRRFLLFAFLVFATGCGQQPLDTTSTVAVEPNSAANETATTETAALETAAPETAVTETEAIDENNDICLLYTSPSPRDS